MKKQTVFILAVLFLIAAGCASAPIESRKDRLSMILNSKNGRYDNNTFLVDTRSMRLSRVIESMYTIRTETMYKTKEKGLVVGNSEGSALALPSGYMLTAGHVVSGKLAGGKADRVIVRTFLEHGGKSYPLERVAMDKKIDVALFRFPKGLSLKSFPYRIGNSDELQVGNFVYVIGNPANLGLNVREGIVSSLRAPPMTVDNFNAENTFMVSNGLNLGDSGTPILAIRDGEYELVGISQGVLMGLQKMGWAVRINVIFRFLEKKISDLSFKNE